MSSFLLFLFALGTGLSVASIYLLQPLLHTVALDLGVSVQQVGLIVTLTQMGYGAGILLLVPLGDVLPKKKLVIAKLALLTVSLILMGFAPTYAAVLAGSLLVGLLATVAQDILPYAADLADERSRGAAVGKVMSGLLLGILLSRTFSGIVADLAGWRSVFWVTAALVAVATVGLARNAREQAPRAPMAYPKLIALTLRNFVDLPPLRRAIFTQACIGFSFSAFWTNLSFYLGQAPFNLRDSQIGMFGLAGAAGAVAAPIAGRLADKRGARYGILWGASLVLISFAAMRVLPGSLFLLLLGAIVFDLGAQMTLVSNQSIIYALNPSARARLNALFVACIFLAFSVGSYVSVHVFGVGGWPSVLTLCLVASALAVVSAISTKHPRVMVS